MADEYEYKDSNTDIMKALSKAVDAATGETGTQYEYKNQNTDVIQKLEELIEAIATSGGGGGGHNYSTTEQIVGTWIDGKTLYEKTLVINNLSSGAYRSVAHGIENLDVVFVKDGFALYTPSGTSNLSSAILSSYNTPAGEEFLGAISHNDFGYRCGAELDGATAYVTIRYTKASI